MTAFPHFALAPPAAAGAPGAAVRSCPLGDAGMREGVVRRAAETIRREGLGGAWFTLLARTLYRRMLLIEHRLDAAPVSLTATVPVSIERLAAADVAAYLRFRPDADRAEIARRLRDGQACFVARHDGRIVRVHVRESTSKSSISRRFASSRHEQPRAQVKSSFERFFCKTYTRPSKKVHSTGTREHHRACRAAPPLHGVTRVAARPLLTRRERRVCRKRRTWSGNTCGSRK